MNWPAIIMVIANVALILVGIAIAVTADRLNRDVIDLKKEILKVTVSVMEKITADNKEKLDRIEREGNDKV